MYVGRNDDDYKVRIYRLLFEKTMSKLMKLKAKDDKRSNAEYLLGLPLIELIAYASIQAQVVCHGIAKEAELENSRLVLCVNDYIPSLVRDVISTVSEGEIDYDLLHQYAFAPISTFTTNDNN
jgi:hypothetical protein